MRIKEMIVAFQPSYYPMLAQTLSVAYGNYAFDAQTLRDQDESLLGAYINQRLMAVQGTRAIAFAEYRQTPEMYHPQKFLINLAVHPDHQGQGIGSRLYAQMLTEIATYQPISIRASCRADNARSIAFLERRGFSRGMHILELHLDLQTLPMDSADLEALPMERGREADADIVTLDRLTTDANRDEKLYHLITAIRSDMPLPATATRVSPDHFVASFLEAPYRLPEATFIAVRHGEYIGFSDLYEDGDGGLYSGLTGVHRRYRQQGVGAALKRAGIRYACRKQYRHIKTFNAAENTAILATNRRAGFVERYAWFHFEKVCSDRIAHADCSLDEQQEGKRNRLL